MNKSFHLHSTNNIDNFVYSVDYLAEIAGVQYTTKFDEKGKPIERESFHKKERIKRILDFLKKIMDEHKSHFSFDYRFTRIEKYKEKYYVNFILNPSLKNNDLNSFITNYHEVQLDTMINLKKYFREKYPLSKIKMMDIEDKDYFQRWIVDHKTDFKDKLEIVKNSNFKINRSHLSEKVAIDIMRYGLNVSIIIRPN